MREYPYDVAISFAGADRALARRLHALVEEAGYRAFYDEAENLWGADLGVHFAEVYAHGARYCVILISPEYVAGAWTMHEFQNALARAITAKGQPYILPLIVRDAEVPGLRSTIAYQRLTERNPIESVAERLIGMLGAADAEPSPPQVRTPHEEVAPSAPSGPAGSDLPRLRVAFTHTLSQDAILVTLSNSGTAPVYLRDISLEVASERQGTQPLTYSEEEIAVHPRDEVHLVVAMGDTGKTLLNIHYDAIALVFRATAYDERDALLRRIEQTLPRLQAPSNIDRTVAFHDGFWRDAAGQMWRL